MNAKTIAQALETLMLAIKEKDVGSALNQTNALLIYHMLVPEECKKVIDYLKLMPGNINDEPPVFIDEDY